MESRVPLLETERLFLVPWSRDFAADLYAFASDPEVTLPADWKPYSAPAQAERAADRLSGRPEWAIVTKESFEAKRTRAVGSIGLSPAKLRGYGYSLCVGYLLAREFWGMGLCAEALNKVAHYVFLGLGAEALCGSHRAGNPRSGRVLEKCGFEYYDYSPKTKPDDPRRKLLYKLTRGNFAARNNYGGEVFALDVYRVNNRPEPKQIDPDNIVYAAQPNAYQCGQACVAMLAGVSVPEAARAMNEEYGTSDEDVAKGLDFYGIPHASLRKPYSPGMILPECCILSLMLPGYGHWSLYAANRFYDPEFGVSDKLPPGAELRYFWEIGQKKLNG